MLMSVSRLLRHYPAKHLGVAGGVFANVRLNRVLAEQLDFEEIFVFPPMGDEGLPIGGSLVYLLQRDGIAHWLKQRRRLKDVYSAAIIPPQRIPIPSGNSRHTQAHRRSH